MLEILVRAFYALHDTWTPVKVGVVAMALNIVLSLALIRVFGYPDSTTRLLESLVTNASFSGTPQPFGIARRGALDASTPVQPGELEVSSNVTAIYYLAPR